MHLFKGSTPSIPGTDSLAKIEYVHLGDLEQCVVIRTKDIHLPVLLFLHGGPGTPETAWLNHFNANLEDHFVVTAWEMRGGGKSYHPDIPPETMTLQQLIRDCHELTGYLKKRFHQQKIYLVGHSFGTLLGTLVAHQYPEDYHAYIGIGQIANTAESEKLSYEWALATAKQLQNRKAIKELESIGSPENGIFKAGKPAVHIERTWVREFGGTFHGKSAMPIHIKEILASPIYTLWDVLHYFQGEKFSLQYLWEDVITTDFYERMRHFDIPIYICQGIYDYQTVYSVAKKYFDSIHAPQKEFFTFGNSAHGTLFEEPEKFLAIMQQIVAQTTQV
jgi:pimeloyl-ACP methyl ester carboxylesterase